MKRGMGTGRGMGLRKNRKLRCQSCHPHHWVAQGDDHSAWPRLVYLAVSKTFSGTFLHGKPPHATFPFIHHQPNNFPLLVFTGSYWLFPAANKCNLHFDNISQQLYFNCIRSMQVCSTFGWWSSGCPVLQSPGLLTESSRRGQDVTKSIVRSSVNLFVISRRLSAVRAARTPAERQGKAANKQNKHKT